MTLLPCRSFPLLTLLIALAACLSLGCAKAPPPNPEEAHPAPVKAVAARSLPVAEWTELLGTTQPLPKRAARVSAAVEGRVLTVLGDGNGAGVVEGQPIEAGQVIVQLDDRVARANRDKVVAAQAEVVEQKKQADYAVELAQIEVKRLEELGRKGSVAGPLPLVSRIELDRARLLLKDAESKQKAVAARQQAGEAELKALDEQLDLYTLRAPIKGRLGLLQVAMGQTLSVGAPVTDVVNLDEVDALCFVPPRAAARLALDQPAQMATEEGAKAPPGKVAFIAVQGQAETGNFPVKVRFPNPELRLQANRVVRVQVQTKPEAKRLTIPTAALLEDQDPPGVVVVTDLETKEKDGKKETLGKAYKLQAVLGVRDRSQQLVEVLELIDPEKKKKHSAKDVHFVIEGAHGLQNGDAVKVEEPEHKDEK